MAVVLAGFLLFAGIGSFYSRNWPEIRAIKVAISGVVVVTLCYFALLPTLFNLFTDYSLTLRMIVAIFLSAPLAFFMGIPFPQGMKFLSRESPEHIPWAWGINGCASVVSAIAATIVAINFGVTIVIISALICYLLASLIFFGKARSVSSQ